MSASDLSPDQVDALAELINIGTGRAGASLDELLGAQVKLAAPEVQVMTAREAESLDRFGGARLAVIRLPFSGHVNGVAALVFPTDSAARLVDVISGEYPAHDDLDGLRIGTLTEVGNILLSGVMGSLSDGVHSHFTYEIPEYLEESLPRLVGHVSLGEEAVVVVARVVFHVANHGIEGEVLVFFGFGSFAILLRALDRLTAREAAA